MITLNSSVIKFISNYDQDTGNITIEFKNGSKYRFYGLEPLTVAKLILAESIGRYYNENIKGKYKFKKLYS